MYNLPNEGQNGKYVIDEASSKANATSSSSNPNEDTNPPNAAPVRPPVLHFSLRPHFPEIKKGRDSQRRALLRISTGYWLLTTGYSLSPSHAVPTGAASWNVPFPFPRN